MLKKSFFLFRFDPDTDQSPRYQHYSLQVEEQWSLCDCLTAIRETIDPTLSFRRSCRSGICGSCAVRVNGKNILACETPVRGFFKKRKIIIEPLPFFPVLKDLIVDFDLFFHSIESIKPYIIHYDNLFGEESCKREVIQTQKQRKLLDGLTECILCGACTSACPTFWFNGKYLGPAAFLKMYRYNQDSRDQGSKTRNEIAAAQNGIWNCHFVFNCLQYCPKGLNPALAIQRIRWMMQCNCCNKQ